MKNGFTTATLKAVDRDLLEYIDATLYGAIDRLPPESQTFLLAYMESLAAKRTACADLAGQKASVEAWRSSQQAADSCAVCGGPLCDECGDCADESCASHTQH